MTSSSTEVIECKSPPPFMDFGVSPFAREENQVDAFNVEDKEGDGSSSSSAKEEKGVIVLLRHSPRASSPGRSSMRIPLLVLTMAVSLLPLTLSFSPTSSMASRNNVWSTFSAKNADAMTISDSISKAPPAALSSSPPSWENLAEILNEYHEIKQQEPQVTLYRDTNGWCPFCERVWIALRAKGIPYDETLISLQSKPSWYKQLVPTSLVPAVLIHSECEDTKKRTLVWESNDILQALDKAFPNASPKLWLDTREFREALDMNDALSIAGFQFLYAGRNDTLTKEDIQERRVAFQDQLDKLDAALAEYGGPFRLGQDFTGMDAIMIPTLERWRYQLPITAEFDILEKRPNLQAWFHAMDTYAPYANRVAGDEFSWTATASQFLRYFGGGEDKPNVAAVIERADAAAAKLSTTFAERGRNTIVEPSFAIEAAIKLISNHEAVAQDCTREEPLSQKHIPRASNEQVANTVLRHVASILLATPDSALETAQRAPLVQVSDTKEGALAARTVACRLCVPRDMSAPAAAVLRGVLATVADRLENA